MNLKCTDSQSITLLSRKIDCEKLFDHLVEYIRTHGIPDDIHSDLRLIIEEIFINIASYAHTNGEEMPVIIDFNSNTDSISITFTDTGIAFDPINDCKKDIDQNDHCNGGMGIHLIMSLTDQQEYNRINQRNVFTVTKYYTKK